MAIFVLEYRLLDKLGRTKKTYNAGVFVREGEIEAAKEQITASQTNNKIAFDVYIADEPIFKLS